MQEEGFTLVELLFAIFIFAIVISSVYGSYRATFHIVHSSESQIALSHKARAVLERITEDMRSLVFSEDGYLSGETHNISGNRGDSLAFISSAHIALRKGDVLSGNTLIQYSLEVDEGSGLLNLYRSDTPVKPGAVTADKDVEENLVCTGIHELRFLYIDEEGNENDEWLSGEEEIEDTGTEGKGATFPVLVYIELTFAESLESDVLDTFKTAVAIPRS